MQQDLLTLPGAFQHFFENHPDAMFVLGVHGHILDANDSAFRMFGYTIEELINTSFVQRLDGSRTKPSGLEGNFKSRTELALLHKRGHCVYVRVTCIPLVSDGRETGTLMALEDITEQREQHKNLLDIQEMFAFISEKSQNIISSYSPDGVITYISPSVKALLGYTPTEVIGKPATAFNHPETNDELLQYRNSLASDQDAERFTGRLRHKNGEYRWYETTVQFIRDESGAIIQTIGVGRDITDRKEAEEKIAYLAYHDPLTELPNRRLFKKRVSLVLQKSAQERHSLMLLDLDEFKYVNDTFGHEIGDQLLVEVAQRLRRVVGDTGVVARLGGDEFTIFLENIENHGDCTRFVQQIKDVISEPIFIEGNVLNVIASIGIACYPGDGDSVETLMRNADVAMYRSKTQN